MSALDDFVKYVKSTAPAGAGKAGGGGGKDPTDSGDLGAPGAGVYNPGDRNWGLIVSNRSLQGSTSHSAGAIRRGKKYDDYEGWQDRDFTVTHNEGENDIHVNFRISARVRGHPNNDPPDERYVADVRVWGESTGLGGRVDADVENVVATWGDLGPWAAVTFTLVIRIEASQLKGGQRTVRRAFSVQADGTTIWGNPVVTPGI